MPFREERLKYGSICFDELNINRDCDIDRLLDLPINPECKKDAQIMMYRQLAGKEKLPFFVDVDHAVTPEDLKETFERFRNVGIEILSVTCDQGAKNRTLANQLGISVNKRDNRSVYTFEHPLDPEKEVFWIWDFVHLYKSLRNHLLDDKTTLPCGSTVTKFDFYHLLDKLSAEVGSEHTSGFHINSDNLECEGQDRQSVSLCTNLLSERTGQAFIKYFPNNKAKKALGKFIICAAKAFKIMTSRCMVHKKDKLKSALRMHYEEQSKILNELKWYMENMKFCNPNSYVNYFRKGIICTIINIFALHSYMKEHLNLPYLMTSHVDQDYQESYNKKMRAADGRGGNRNPTGLQLNYRIAKDIACSILNDEFSRSKGFSIFDMKDELSKDLKKEKFCDDSLIMIPRKIKESEADGIFWGAGFVAFKMKDIQPLGAYERDATTAHAKNKFTSLVNRGNLQLPLKTWLKDYHEIERYFHSYHPKNGIRPGRGLLNNFFIQIKKRFPNYDDRVLQLTTRVLTRFRMRKVNRILQEKDRARKNPHFMTIRKGKKATPITPRGRKKGIETQFNC